jgi:hypothetical protein
LQVSCSSLVSQNCFLSFPFVFYQIDSISLEGSSTHKDDQSSTSMDQSIPEAIVHTETSVRSKDQQNMDTTDLETSVLKTKKPSVGSTYEEAYVCGMSVSDEGFCVFLQGSISGRIIKVKVTPIDPMLDGVDTENVVSSEAVTLLQLFQGIDVETILPRDALASKFEDTSNSAITDSAGNSVGGSNGGTTSTGGGSGKQKKYRLRRVRIDSLGGQYGQNDDQDRTDNHSRERNDRDGFSATLVGVPKRTSDGSWLECFASLSSLSDTIGMTQNDQSTSEATTSDSATAASEYAVVSPDTPTVSSTSAATPPTATSDVMPSGLSSLSSFLSLPNMTIISKSLPIPLSKQFKEVQLTNSFEAAIFG